MGLWGATSALIRREVREVISLQHERTSKEIGEATACETEEEPSPRAGHCCQPDLGLPAPGSMGNRVLGFEPPTLWSVYDSNPTDRDSTKQDGSVRVRGQEERPEQKTVRVEAKTRD